MKDKKNLLVYKIEYKENHVWTLEVLLHNGNLASLDLPIWYMYLFSICRYLHYSIHRVRAEWQS